VSDPFAILGIEPGATAREITDAYRQAAKRWHPDRGGGAEAEGRMAEVNVAYDLLRDGGWRSQAAAQASAPPGAPHATPAAATGRGAWLARGIREALGAELLAALSHEEDVRLVTPVSTWASARALLAVTDRRLLWLLDDAIIDRVQSLRFSDVASVEQRLRRPRRRVAVLRLVTTNGRRVAFSDLRPATADAIARRIAAGQGS
jgi:hypothetical protein